MIELDDVDFAWPAGDFRLRVARLEVARGERVAVVGPSGAGKTTLLRLFAGLERPRAGRVVVDGVALSELSERARRAFRLARIGLVFQELELIEHLSALDNVLLPYRLGALRLDAAARGRARALLAEVGLAGAERRLPRALSQGERQRVALCRALVTAPPLLFADEPTASLDAAARERALDLLVEQAERVGATLVVVTHDAAARGRFERAIDAREWS